MLCGWLGGFPHEEAEAESGRLLTIEEVGEILEGIPLACEVGEEGKLKASGSPGEPQGSRCLPSDHRGVPPSSH